jgi:two-component system, LuxR family, sensor kinase FixL
LLVTLMSILIATWVARRITQPIKALETGAQALRRHEAVPLAATGVQEVDQALDAFGVLSQALIEHEKERSRHMELIRASEERLRATVDTAFDAIIVIDEDGVVRSVNPAVERIFGYQIDEIVGKNVTLLMPEVYRGAHGDHVDAYRRTGIARAIGIGREVEGLRKDGTTFPVELSVAEWRMGEKRFFTGIVRDISVRKQAEEERHTLLAELLHASRLSEIGRMAAAFAHELNQPLTAVSSYIGGCRRILRAGIDDEERTQRLLGVMEQANAQALRAGQVIRQLREFIGTGQRERTIEDARNVMREACAFAMTTAKHNGILVRFDINQAGHILVDKIQFQQVVINLVRNAIEAMDSSPRKELDLGLALRGGKSEVSVSDTGSGIDPEMAGRLFKPFSTTKSEGMGIGLSVCREIVEAHDGKIWAEPNPGGGTVFRFALPLVRDDEMLAKTASHPPAT